MLAISAFWMLAPCRLLFSGQPALLSDEYTVIDTPQVRKLRYRVKEAQGAKLGEGKGGLNLGSGPCS